MCILYALVPVPCEKKCCSADFQRVWKDDKFQTVSCLFSPNSPRQYACIVLPTVQGQRGPLLGGWDGCHCATSFVVLAVFNFLCSGTCKVLIVTRSHTSSRLMKQCGVHPDQPSLQLELQCLLSSQASYLSVIACFSVDLNLPALFVCLCCGSQAGEKAWGHYSVFLCVYYSVANQIAVVCHMMIASLRQCSQSNCSILSYDCYRTVWPNQISISSHVIPTDWLKTMLLSQFLFLRTCCLR